MSPSFSFRRMCRNSSKNTSPSRWFSSALQTLFLTVVIAAAHDKHAVTWANKLFCWPLCSEKLSIDCRKFYCKEEWPVVCYVVYVYVCFDLSTSLGGCTDFDLYNLLKFVSIRLKGHHSFKIYFLLFSFIFCRLPLPLWPSNFCFNISFLIIYLYYRY